MNLCLRKQYFRPNLIGSLFRFATTSTEIVENDQVFIDDEESQAREAEINQKRNISRLTPAHYNLVNGRKPYEEPKSLAHLTVKYNRKMYGKYGSASGVNPSICFPSRQDIQEKIEYEAVAYPYTIQQMMESAARQRKEEREKIEKRDRDVAAKFAKLEQWKKELNDKLAKKTAEVSAAKEKKERLVEEVRRHFGFKLDPRDERFQEMLAKREKEQKKLEKLARKEAKEKMMIAKLQQKNVELADAKK
ncbi:growth arrest and DNA damage-inducible proteins-interacting protein 1 [Trichoplusia ni]|uniref:Large ribosomal subunit protein mL64 n=1 Tax=Trichoplusia ni TaxID=7111 RepID=A0A7E5X2P7_TRINI|nr:growth arrest and DNA damage-inducible proteins-interacting protein 1 [Trichoplusia ni]